MGKKIDLLRNYPKSKRDLNSRKRNKNAEIVEIARKFGKDFFDGERDYGYGGFLYNSKFWQPVIPDFIEYYNLSSDSKVLDVGCAKGFMIYDFIQILPEIKIQGIDISTYAIDNSLPEVREFLKVGSADKLPFKDNEFDLVISINTIHNLDLGGCSMALKEIERVSKKNSFITVDSYTNEEEKKNMYDWNLTAKTILSESDWINLFDEIGYTGDYFWFIP